MDEIEELKKEINTFVWMHVTGDTTLDRAEEISVAILKLLRPEDLERRGVI